MQIIDPYSPLRTISTSSTQHIPKEVKLLSKVRLLGERVIRQAQPLRKIYYYESEQRVWLNGKRGSNVKVCAVGRCSRDGALNFCADFIVPKLEKITKILQSRHYNILSPPTEDCIVRKNDDLDDYGLTIQDGLHIFRPTADELNDFENFLQRVEDIAGRETGVVKVIVPKEL